MKAFRRIGHTACAATVCLFLLAGLSPLTPAAAETLADVDADIQGGDTTPTRIAGQAAYNVYTDVTGNPNSFLNRKIVILNAAGITNFASVGSYNNFYSFTGRAGFTDTNIDIVTTASALRLYRRGSSSRLETQSYLGNWWGGSYLGTGATRDGQAVLAAWGSDLNRIYVIDVPAGTTLVGGQAAPMEQGGEYRAGGAYQYYYRGVPLSWLVYAIYAPDYLKSYASAVTGAQRLGRGSLEDIGGHLDDLRHRTLTNGAGDAYAEGAESPARQMPAKGSRGDGGEKLTNTWFRFYGGYSRLNDGGETGQKTQGLHLGWEKLVRGGASGGEDRWHIGAVLGQGSLAQNDVASDVKNDITHTYGGVYSVYQSHPDRSRSWYGSAALLYGHLRFANKVPGELAGYGLNQDYSGKMLAAMLDSGLTFRRSDGWFVEPQLKLYYTKVLQDAFTDKLGANVSVQRGESLAGRLGIMVLRKKEIGGGRQSTLWARASYQREFCGKNRVDVAGDGAISGSGRNVYQLDVGVDFDISGSVSVSGDVTRVFGDERGCRGSLALKSFW